MKPEYDAGKNLKEQMESVVALYDSEMSLQAIGEELGLNPIKVRKLLITADVYESEVAEKVQAPFKNTVKHKTTARNIPTIRHILQHSRRSSRWFGVLCDDEGKKASVKLAEIVIYWER